MDDNEQLDSGGEAATLEAKARTMGWAPKEKWRGDPNEWVDAQEFLDRGERLMPILKANNRKLEEQAQGLEQQNRQLAAQIEELRGSMSEFVEAQREMMEERLRNQRTDIRRQIREAREAGDDAAIERLEETLDENTEQTQKLKEQKAPAAGRREPPPNPDYEVWQKANPWFQGTSREDARRTALAYQFGREAAQAGLRGKAFFDYIDEQMEDIAPVRERPTDNKVESGRPSGSPASGNSGFDALPSEAKAQAKRDVARFVGPNKIFKTEKEWYAHFTKLYNGA